MEASDVGGLASPTAVCPIANASAALRSLATSTFNNGVVVRPLAKREAP